MAYTNKGHDASNVQMNQYESSASGQGQGQGEKGDVPPPYSAFPNQQQQQQQPQQQQAMAVVAQPVAMGFANPGIPPGLEYLAQLNRIDIHQILHLEEVLLGFERNNQYQICNEQNQEFLHVKEDTDCCTRQFCGNMRPFDIFINNMQGQPVIQLHRDLHCQGVCCCCCLQQMDIMYPPGNVVATIKEIWSCSPHFEIHDTSGNLMYTINGPCCWCLPCTEIPFEISRHDGADAGNITKHWGGCREMFGQVNDFSLTYAQGEPPLNKGILLGATFLIDFMYFEHKQK